MAVSNIYDIACTRFTSYTENHKQLALALYEQDFSTKDQQ